MSLRTIDYDFALPDELIARHPPERREDARMMLIHRETGLIEHRSFTDFPGLLRGGDLVVLNDTRVMPARVFSDDARVELLLVEEVAPHRWQCLVKPGRRMRAGAEVRIRGVRGVVGDILPDGQRVIQFDGPLDMEAAGHLPLPPYLGRAAEPADALRYQTTYARVSGAVAAPTAGLHFTPEILAQVPHVFVTLHVGLGTFRSVLVDDITGHVMHSERFHLPAATAQAIGQASRVIAVGTTSTRVLESCAALGMPLREHAGSTDIFIHPPYDFRVVGALLTNFHLPQSTLIMLVSAFAGRELTLRAYAEGIRERYRFYSYGDCMFIV